MNGFKKNAILLVLQFQEISLWPDLSSQLCFRIQGKVPWAWRRTTDGGRIFLCLTLHWVCQASVFFLLVSHWVILRDSLLHRFHWNYKLEICFPLTNICFSRFLWYNFSICIVVLIGISSYFWFPFFQSVQWQPLELTACGK